MKKIPAKKKPQNDTRKRHEIDLSDMSWALGVLGNVCASTDPIILRLVRVILIGLKDTPINSLPATLATLDGQCFDLIQKDCRIV